jgi:hypothetical protein
VRSRSRLALWPLFSQLEGKTLKHTYAQIALLFDLWIDYVDPLDTMSYDEFDAMPFADRIALIETIFGPEQ